MRPLLATILLFFNFTVYGQTESDVVLKTKEGYSISGSLSVPENSSKSLVILISGSGPTDRDGNNVQMKNNSLKLLSTALVDEGYACLRYDKRAIAKSRIENFNQREMSFDHFIADASSWVDKYSTHFENIILAGHSQGSLVAIVAAKQNKNVDAVISIAGAGRPIHEILKTQLSASLSAQMQGLVNAKLDTLAMGDTLKSTPDLLHSIMHPSVQPFLISWMKYDPAKEIAKLNLPILLVNGTTDIQIPLSEAKILAESNENAKLVKIKNMNHVLKKIKSTSQSNQLEVYGNPDIPLHKKLPKAIFKFLSKLN